MKATEREIKGSFEGSQRKIAEAKNEILVEERRLSENDGGRNSRLIEEQDQHEREAQRARDALEDLEAKNKENKSALEVAKREVSKARTAVESCMEDAPNMLTGSLGRQLFTMKIMCRAKSLRLSVL